MEAGEDNSHGQWHSKELKIQDKNGEYRVSDG